MQYTKIDLAAPVYLKVRADEEGLDIDCLTDSSWPPIRVGHSQRRGPLVKDAHIKEHMVSSPIAIHSLTVNSTEPGTT